MPSITAAFPHSPLTAEPNRLTAREVWAVAQSVRSQIAPATERRIDIERLVEAAQAPLVNGLPFMAHWDLDHEVRNEADEPVMGTTHFDPAEPGSVMVSVNGARLSGRDDLLRSTIAHELGHVVFDAPGWITANARPQIASFKMGPGWRAETGSDRFARGRTNRASQGATPRDWREFRANEFMGALLVPSGLLRLDFVRLAKQRRLPASPRPSAVVRGAPAFDGATLEAEAVEDILFVLAGRFGVSETFIRVRLDRYDLLRSGRTGASI